MGGDHHDPAGLVRGGGLMGTALLAIAVIYFIADVIFKHKD
ncbi:hypothetical protein J2S40_001658 [Nocardioides luteus]|nr:hypothetical protein [Nocardioides luteus]